MDEESVTVLGQTRFSLRFQQVQRQGVAGRRMGHVCLFLSVLIDGKQGGIDRLYRPPSRKMENISAGSIFGFLLRHQNAFEESCQEPYATVPFLL
jgi:hypothetical protein